MSPPLHARRSTEGASSSVVRIHQPTNAQRERGTCVRTRRRGVWLGGLVDRVQQMSQKQKVGRESQRESWGRGCADDTGSLHCATKPSTLSKHRIISYPWEENGNQDHAAVIPTDGSRRSRSSCGIEHTYHTNNTRRTTHTWRGAIPACSRHALAQTKCGPSQESGKVCSDPVQVPSVVAVETETHTPSTHARASRQISLDPALT